MNTLPKVSVMIVTYNQAAFIRETLDSVLAQEYENLEIVVADDASSDATPEILQEYAAKYPHTFVLVLHEHNQGITRNCNSALQTCTGEFIAILGGDDVFLPGKIRAQVTQFLEDPKVTLSYHPVEIFQSETGRVLYVTNRSRRESPLSAHEIIMHGGIDGASSVMVRRSACPPGGFDERLPVVSDWLFYIEAAAAGKVAKAEGIYGRYRKHARGTTQRVVELLDETLYSLDLVVEKHPEQPELAEICRKGKARYIAGEAFRQIGINATLSHRLSQQAVALDPFNLRYRLLLLCSSYQPVAAIAGALLNRSKYFIKRYLLSV
jgi:glycosyltransferase involved in cell wall biosynthesis